ncbi:MAG: hypothetical protein LW855_03535 [Alphaproteobacteria bacterium]|jgi:hypothetical protein|nr:hypothetical protein [Alphaproteobacteria bacterium]
MLGLFSALLEALTKGATSGLKGLQSSLGGGLRLFTATSLAVSAILPTTASAATLLNNTALNLGNLAGSAAQTSLQVKQQTTSAVLSTSKLIAQAPLEAAGYAAQPVGALWQGTYQVARESMVVLGEIGAKAVSAIVPDPKNPFTWEKEGFKPLLSARQGGGNSSAAWANFNNIARMAAPAPQAAPPIDFSNSR